MIVFPQYKWNRPRLQRLWTVATVLRLQRSSMDFLDIFRKDPDLGYKRVVFSHFNPSKRLVSIVGNMSDSSEVSENSSEVSEEEEEEEQNSGAQDREFQWRWSQIRHKPDDFKRAFKFTVDQFEEILWPEIEDLFVRNRQKGGNAFKLDEKTSVLLVLAFLRKGFTYPDLAFNFGISPARARFIIQENVRKISARLNHHITWNSWRNQDDHLSENDGERFSRCVCIVDATEHECNRPAVNQKNFYSGKSKMHCIKTQIAIEPVSGRIMHVYSGIEGKRHDKKIFDESGIADLVRAREFVMADCGYVGIGSSVPALLPFKKPRNRELTNEQKLWNRRLGRKRVLVENVFGSLKKWKILHNRWIAKTTRLEWYSMIFKLCCIFHNMLNH